MRIAVVSDIHGNLAALEAVAADFRRRGVDAVVNLGDNLSGPMLPQQTADYLRASGWTHLAGNHERQLLALGNGVGGADADADADPADAYARSMVDTATLAWLATLRDTCAYADDIFLCHASPRRDVEYLLETVTPEGLRIAAADEIAARCAGRGEALLLCGHTHVPRCVRRPGGQLIVNPGSVGLPAFDDAHPHFHKVENGAPDARYAIVERIATGGGNGDRWQAELIAVPYAFEPMARLAEAQGMRGWAHALRYGYMP